MEESISNFSKSLASFCNHLQNSCHALKQSVDRRPIPLDSASSTFIQGLNRRASAVSNDLNLLESMSFETVSFEELLGHFNEVYKKNESDIAELQIHLKGVGYVPDFEVDDEDENYNHVSTSGLLSKLSCSKDRPDLLSSYQRPVSKTDSAMHSLGEDILLDDSLSLQNAGISDVCLATLASEGKCTFDDKYMDLHTPEKFLDSKVSCQSTVHIMGVSEGKDEDNSIFKEAVSSLIKLSKDDYESLPSYMKGLAPWEDLLATVEKINSYLEAKATGKHYIRQDEISSMDLGPKARSYLLLLVRLKRVIVETIDGQICYRVL